MQVDIRQIQDTHAFSCLSCGKCTGTCPVARYANTFSPRQILSHSIFDTHPSPELWSCLTCKQCDEICPSDIKYIDLIQLLREGIGVEDRQGTCSHGGILESISRIMTSSDMKQDRLQWVDKGLKTSTDSEYLYFVGCLPYFDVLFEDLDVHAADIARSTLKILNKLGIEPQLLANEKCCGHDFFWNGDIKNFEKLANENLKMFEESGVKTIITSCPECYRTLAEDYKAINGKTTFHVMHISEVIKDKIGDTGLKLKADQQTVTFQDPCRLGRHMGVYDAPRDVIGQIEGIELKEMAHHHKRAICCGVSGWMNCSQVSKQIQAQRLNEAIATGADTLVTSCAKCKIHFKCALQDQALKKRANIKITDLTELVAQNIC